MLITGSFDETAMIWDVRVKEPTHVLRGHEAEISNCIWNFSFNLIATSSLDGTVRVWDLRNIKEPQISLKHRDEVLDVCFDYTGKIATCSSDCTAKVWDEFGKLLITLEGHTDEVSKVCFSPNGSLILTASAGERNKLRSFPSLAKFLFRQNCETLVSQRFTRQRSLCASSLGTR